MKQQKENFTTFHLKEINLEPEPRRQAPIWHGKLQLQLYCARANLRSLKINCLWSSFEGETTFLFNYKQQGDLRIEFFNLPATS